MQRLRVVIVDDEPLAIRGLKLELRRVPGVEVVGTAADGQSGLDLIGELAPDIALLDVQMPRLDGLQMADALSAGDAPAIIFVTAFGHFAVAAFELNAVDYVLKPINTDRLKAAIDRARIRLEQTTAAQRAAELTTVLEALRRDPTNPFERSDVSRSLWLSDARGRRRLLMSSIDWLEAQRDYVRIHTDTQSFVQRGTLADLSRKLDPGQFLRVHRSAIVNLEALTGIERRGWGLVAARLRSGVEVPVGRSYLAELRERLRQTGVTSIRGQG